MAITAGVSEPKQEAHVYKYKWLAVPNGNQGSPIGAGASANYDLAVYQDKSIHVEGTFGAGGSCQLEGSNDGGANFRVLKDKSGNAIIITGAGLVQLTMPVEQIRPNVTAGDGTTALNFYLYMRKINV